MEENFFIEHPEELENNFYNKQETRQEFKKQFKEKSKEIVKVMSMKHRHAKKVNKKKSDR